MVSFKICVLVSCLALVNAQGVVNPFSAGKGKALNTANSGWPMNLFGANPYVPPAYVNSLNQVTKSTRIANAFDKNTTPLSDSTGVSIKSLTKLTQLATPLINEMAIALIPKINEYTDALAKHNTQGGDFPAPPKELLPFGLGFFSSATSSPASNRATDGSYSTGSHYQVGDYKKSQIYRKSIGKITSRGRVVDAPAY